MAVFLIAEIEKIVNQAKYDIYLDKVRSIVLSYGGEYVLNSEEVIPFSGKWNPEKIIILKFHTKEELKKCFSSKEYLEIKHYREASTKGRAVLIHE